MHDLAPSHILRLPEPFSGSTKVNYLCRADSGVAIPGYTYPGESQRENGPWSITISDHANQTMFRDTAAQV